MLGGTIAGCVVGGSVLGLLADSALGTSPALLLVGLGLGILSAVLITYTKVRSYLR